MSSLIIPHDFLTDIFYRLPVEALLRFRSLSKSCCSLIDSPEFVKLHLDQSVKTRSISTIFMIKPKVKGSIYAVDLDSSDMYPVKLKYVKSKPGEFHVIGSCNGLLAVKIGEKISLWNPCTRKRQILPLSVKSNQSYVGFGYDAISDDYKVIIIKPHRNRNRCRVLIYYLKTNSSRKIYFDIDHPDCYTVSYSTMCVFVGGCLNWIRRPMVNKRILAFDLGKEKFKDFMMPANVRRYDPVTSFAELGGCLSIGYSYSRIFLEIWIMKEYGVEESWAMTLYFSFTGIGRCVHLWKPLYYSRSEDEVILTDQYGEFQWYDLEQNVVVKKIDLFKSSTDHEKHYKVLTNVCVRSIVPLNDNVKNRRTEKKRKRRKETEDK